MGIPYIICTVSDSTDISVSSQVLETAVTSGTDVVENFEKFLNMDFFNSLCSSYAQIFAIGFAFTTILILFSFGVFKAFSLVRID